MYFIQKVSCTLDMLSSIKAIPISLISFPLKHISLQYIPSLFIYDVFCLAWSNEQYFWHYILYIYVFQTNNIHCTSFFPSFELINLQVHDVLWMRLNRLQFTSLTQIESRSRCGTLCLHGSVYKSGTDTYTLTRTYRWSWFPSWPRGTRQTSGTLKDTEITLSNWSCTSCVHVCLCVSHQFPCKYTAICMRQALSGDFMWWMNQHLHLFRHTQCNWNLYKKFKLMFSWFIKDQYSSTYSAMAQSFVTACGQLRSCQHD